MRLYELLKGLKKENTADWCTFTTNYGSVGHQDFSIRCFDIDREVSRWLEVHSFALVGGDLSVLLADDLSHLSDPVQAITNPTPFNTCDCCGKPITAGYVTNFEDTYMCEDCHSERFSDDEWRAICEEDEDNNYYTEWEGDYIEWDDYMPCYVRKGYWR